MVKIYAIKSICLRKIKPCSKEKACSIFGYEIFKDFYSKIIILFLNVVIE